MANVAKDLAQIISQSKSKKTGPYDTPAKVKRIDGKTVWVSIPGGIDETPIDKTVNCSVGDTVQVRVSGGRAWITGNATAPPTDDTTANVAKTTAVYAQATALDAKSTADAVEDIAISAQNSANTAASAAAQAVSDAEAAATAADSAVASAETANSSATIALTQLDVIENVVGVLDLLSKNGDYQLTTDTEVQLNKWYFIQTGTSPDYLYQVVSDPTGDPSAQGWYELVGIDQAVQNYVSSHLVLDNTGLWLQTDGNSSKLQLSPSGGVTIYNEDGNPVAQYGTDTIIGDVNSFHIKIDSSLNEIGFYQAATKVAYMNGSALYVENSLSFGHFIFYERENGHFTLKRIN